MTQKHSPTGTSSHNEQHPLRRPMVLGILVIWIVLGCLGITFNLRNPFPYFYFFADEATYYTMGYSLAFDGDLTYAREDIERVCREWADGPTGIFLKKSSSDTITFGKSYLYPLFSALPVRLFGTNGFLLTNTLAFCLMITLGAFYLSRFNTDGMAILFSILYFVMSASWLYMFWIHPEVLVMALITAGLFLWFQGRQPTLSREIVRLSFIALFLGMATFAKVTNAIFIVPVALDLLFSRPRAQESEAGTDHGLMARLGKTVLISLLFILVLGSLFYVNKIATGDWNYQWGERKGFARQFPFEKEGQTFESTGSSATRSDLAIKPGPGLLFRNLYYFFVGRFGGLVPYFLPCILVMITFVTGKRTLSQYLLLGALIIQQLFFFIYTTDNYLGGMGAIGNRYFLNSYPAILFLAGRRVHPAAVLCVLLICSLFLAPMLVNPLAHSFQPAEHTFAFPYKYLPIELTQIDFLPIHINHHLTRRPYNLDPPYRLTFFDYQTHLPENEGFWVRPGPAAEVIMETRSVLTGFDVSVQNGPYQNTIVVSTSSQKQTIKLDPWGEKSMPFKDDPDYRHNGWNIHTITVKSKVGFIPRFHDPESSDRRFLGCFVRIDASESESDTG